MLARSRLLIVEDDPIIGFDLAEQLSEAGFEIAGVATGNRRAVKLLHQSRCDAAVVDIYLHGETSEPLARALAKLRVPCVVVSAYLDEAIPDLLAHAPKLRQPVALTALMGLLRVLLI